jgi:hypothetical protein
VVNSITVADFSANAPGGKSLRTLSFRNNASTAGPVTWAAQNSFKGFFNHTEYWGNRTLTPLHGETLIVVIGLQRFVQTIHGKGQKTFTQRFTFD